MISEKNISLTVLLCWLAAFGVPSAGAIECSGDAECQTLLNSTNTFCENGSCTNPFASGCLRNALGHDARICNSDDKTRSDGLKGNMCLMSPLNYTEIRIHNSNWESSIFFSWILQIWLSERLGVPATVGLSSAVSPTSSFYNYEMDSLAYSSAAYPFHALEEASRVGDCSKTSNDCANVLPEVWNGQIGEWQRGLDEGFLETVDGNGEVGKISFYVPAFVADRDESLVSFFGLSGEENREKLASTFLRPTTWKAYCEEVSDFNCTTADDVAQRYPDPAEENMYHSVEFIGHFRATDENNCTMNRDTCTGHIVGPPCTWSTNMDAQLHWNNISLASSGDLEPNNGYSYGSMLQIWRAANATKSNVIMWWWKPDPTVEEFRGTDAEFQLVLLPEATEECSSARITPGDRCSPDPLIRYGEEDGACDTEAHALQKVLSTQLSQDMPIALKSPAYDAIKRIKLSDLEVNSILKNWVNDPVDRWGHGPRKAVCDWVVDHLDVLDSFVPKTYPREFDSSSSYQEPWLSAFIVLSCFATLMVAGVAALIYRYRKSRVMIVSQLIFSSLVLAGFMMNSIGALLFVIEPSKFGCIATTLLVSLGFSLRFVPLLVKSWAITKIDSSAKKMKRVTVNPKTLIFAVVSVVMVEVIYLMVWIIADTPDRTPNYVLSKDDETVVKMTLSCSSENEFWILVVYIWEALLLVSTTVLAVQSRNVTQEFNESKILGALVYCNLFFFLLRLIVYVLKSNFDPATIAAMNSFLWSMDTISGVSIYFLPKLMAVNSKSADGKEGRNSMSRIHSTFSGAEAFKNFSSASRVERIVQKSAFSAFESSCSLVLEEPSESLNSSSKPTVLMQESSNGALAIDMSGSTKSQNEMSQEKQDSKRSSFLTDSTAPMSV